ncbi:MAG: hypothetical protein ACFFB2_03485 [Promethearchaeota archaeon]
MDKRNNRVSLLLRITSVLTFTSLIILFGLTWISNWDPFIWTLTQYLGPLLFLGIWTPLAGSFLTLRPEISSIRKTFFPVLFGSILVVLGALLLNQRLILLLLEAISGLFILESTTIELFVVTELIFGIILPANEEFMKIIPLIVILQSPIVLFNPEISDSTSEFETHFSVATLRQIGFYGIVSGTIFTFLELFLNQWSAVDASGSTEGIFFQILFRTLFPLHILATFLISLGIGKLKISLVEKQNSRTAILTSSGYFILGWGFHSFWNTINVIYGVYLPDAVIELYSVLAIFGIFAVLLLLFEIINNFRNQPEICLTCGLEVLNPHFHNGYYSNKTLDIHKNIPVPRILTHISVNKLRKHISCPFCFNPLILGTCSTCGASSFVICSHCSGFISETTSLCPHCNKKVTPLIELHLKALSQSETYILGITSLASMAFLLAPLTILIFGQMDGLGSIINPILIFYFLMGLTTLINVIISLLFNRTAGMLVLFCYFLVLILLIFIILIGFMIVGFMRAVVTQDILGLVFVFMGGLFLTFFIYRFIITFFFNYSPVFPEYQIHKNKILGNSLKEVRKDAS